MERRRFLGRGGRPRPGDDLLEGGALDPQAGLPSLLAQAGRPASTIAAAEPRSLATQSATGESKTSSKHRE